jgi:hypothetical protein
MDMASFNPLTAILGGVLIGLSTTVLLAWNGRIAGISGIASGLLRRTPGNTAWRIYFLVGMLAGGFVYQWGAPQPTPTYALAPIAMILGGLLVGFGTRLGNGCTSGHGVCGLGRLSPRSLAAVVTFLTTAIATTFVIRHML